MPFQKGNSGRPIGSHNRLTKTVKEAVLIAFQELQESEDHKLTSWAKNNLTDFYKIASKLIPTEITATVKKSVEDDYSEEEIDAAIIATTRLTENSNDQEMPS